MPAWRRAGSRVLVVDAGCFWPANRALANSEGGPGKLPHDDRPRPARRRRHHQPRFGRPQRRSATAAASWSAEEGLILTVGHVLSKPNGGLIAVFPDGRRAKAVALGPTAPRNVGMAKITEPGNYPYVELGKSADETGSMVPGDGASRRRAWKGARRRSVSEHPRRRQWRHRRDGIRTDAPVISGDSGGPLFDLDGKFIGIHSNIGMLVTQNRHVPVNRYRENGTSWWPASRPVQVVQMLARGPPPPGFKPEDLRSPFNGCSRQHVEKTYGIPKSWHDEERASCQCRARQDEGTSRKMGPWGGPADQPLDFLRFHRLFEDRLIAGDRAVLGLIRGRQDDARSGKDARIDGEVGARRPGSRPAAAPGIDRGPVPADARRAPARRRSRRRCAAFQNGQAQLSLEQTKELLSKWEKGPKLDLSKVDPADVNAILKQGKLPSNGHLNLEVKPENPFRLLPLLLLQGLHGGGEDAKVGKGGPVGLSGEAGRGCRGGHRGPRPVPRGSRWSGTVVRKDGYMLAKASEMKDKLACKIGTRQYCRPRSLQKKDDFGGCPCSRSRRTTCRR